MRYIADFHIHSRFSIATSKKLVPEYLEYWARIKGINLIGTGDCIHPGWFAELKEKLEPCDNGLFRLKKEYRLAESAALKHDNIPHEVFFVLTGELSSIYKKNDKVRKVHNITVFPDFDSLESVQKRLDESCNIRSDGRPILGIDSKTILDMVLNSSDRAFIIPAHIWTPWFSVLGAKSGFDSIDECYEDLTPYIFALETGLSSDPTMNRGCSILDKFRLVSNSDAHSPEKLGREANLFDAELSYTGFYEALKFDRGFRGTVEFFPNEGKYFYDGHRKCGIVWSPAETEKHKGICPVCNSPVTPGVMHRVAELADRDISEINNSHDFYSITQLPDLLAEIAGCKSSSAAKVTGEYFRLIKALGSEFHILLDAEQGEISEKGSEVLAEGVRRLRSGEVHVENGFDGQFGTIKVFAEGELQAAGEKNLFGESSASGKGGDGKGRHGSMSGFKKRVRSSAADCSGEEVSRVAEDSGFYLTEEQRSGVIHRGSPLLIIAGPGSGKTRVLAERIRDLLDKGEGPSSVAALTFSVRAAEEIKDRIRDIPGSEKIHVSTIHAMGLALLKQHYAEAGLNENFRVIDENEKKIIAGEIFNREGKSLSSLLNRISLFKQNSGDSNEELMPLYDAYNSRLRELNLADFDDLVHLPVKMFRENKNLMDHYGKLFDHLLVDEFQDINALQYEFIKFLAPLPGRGLFAIGDPDQAIYGFRGADVKYISSIETDYPDMKKITLTKSFRCSDFVIKAGRQVLKSSFYPEGATGGVKINIHESASCKSEADWIASEIERLMGGVRSFSMYSGISDGASSELGFSDFAVLCRSSFMFDAVIKAFEDHGIAYNPVDDEPFFTKDPYAGAIDIIRKIYYNMNMEGEKYAAIAEMINSGKPFADVIKSILIIQEKFYDLEKLDRAFGNIKSPEEFFSSISLRKGADDYLSRAEQVSVMTIHAAKGLEFKTVFVPGCEDGIIPFTLFGDTSPEYIASEERLLYVAVTRAKQNLYLSSALSRNYKGRILKPVRSPFLDRIEKKLLQQMKREGRDKEADYQMKLF